MMLMPIITKAIIWHVFKKNIPIPKPLCVVLFGTRLLCFICGMVTPSREENRKLARLTNLDVSVWANTSISTIPKKKQTQRMTVDGL